MPALNFKRQFSESIKNGRKVRTIRKKRKNSLKVGEKVSLYTGQRTKECKKIGMGIIVNISDVFICVDSVRVNNRALSKKDKNALAKADGFSNFADFSRFFHNLYDLPFYGVIIKWELQND